MLWPRHLHRCTTLQKLLIRSKQFHLWAALQSRCPFFSTNISTWIPVGFPDLPARYFLLVWLACLLCKHNTPTVTSSLERTKQSPQLSECITKAIQTYVVLHRRKTHLFWAWVTEWALKNVEPKKVKLQVKKYFQDKYWCCNWLNPVGSKKRASFLFLAYIYGEDKGRHDPVCVVKTKFCIRVLDNLQVNHYTNTYNQKRGSTLWCQNEQDNSKSCLTVCTVMMKEQIHWKIPTASVSSRKEVEKTTPWN